MSELQPMDDGRYWYDVSPQEAASFKGGLAHESAPLNELGEPCPWPWEPQQLIDVPLGQYHCEYCGGMVMAGMRHLDYRGSEDGLR